MTEIIISFIGGMALVASTTIPVILQKEKNKNEQKKHVTKHQFFSDIDFWINVRIDRIDTGHAKKTIMVKKFLKIILKEFKDTMFEVAKKVDEGEHNYDYNGLIALISECIKSYEQNAIAEGVPKMFVKKFRGWHYGHIKTTYDAIKYICSDSVVYHGCYEKFWAVLDILLYALHTTIYDAERTMKFFNGQLEDELDKNFVTRSEFEMSEKVQNMQIKELLKGKK